MFLPAAGANFWGYFGVFSVFSPAAGAIFLVVFSDIWWYFRVFSGAGYLVTSQAPVKVEKSGCRTEH